MWAVRSSAISRHIFAGTSHPPNRLRQIPFWHQKRVEIGRILLPEGRADAEQLDGRVEMRTADHLRTLPLG